MALTALLLLGGCKKGDDKPNNENPPAEEKCGVSEIKWSNQYYSDGAAKFDLYEGDYGKIAAQKNYDKDGYPSAETRYSYSPDGKLKSMEKWRWSELQKRWAFQYPTPDVVSITGETLDAGGKLRQSLLKEYTFGNGRIVAYSSAMFNTGGSIAWIDKYKVIYSPEGNPTKLIQLKTNGEESERNMRYTYDDKPNPFYNRLELLFTREVYGSEFIFFSKNNLIDYDYYPVYYPDGKLKSIRSKADTSRHFFDFKYMCK